MPRSTFLPRACAAALLLVPAARGSAQGAERHTLRGDGVAIYHVVGSMRVVAGAGSDVTVEVTRRGRDATQTAVEQGAIGGRETLRIFPRTDRVVYPPMKRGTVRAELRRDGTFGGESGGRFVFSRGSADGLEIRGDGRGAETWADVVVSVPAGRRVALHLLAGDATVRGVDGALELDLNAASLAVDGTRGRLTVDAGSGEVRVADAQGEIALDLGSGSVELSRLRGPSLRVDAGSGALRGTDVDAERVQLDLGSGNTSLQRVRARTLSVEGGSGNIDVGLLAGVDDVRLDSGSGSVTLRVPDDFGATLDVDTGSGGIDVELPMTVTKRERDHLTGRIGDGRTRVSIETGSGSVRLRRADR